MHPIALTVPQMDRLAEKIFDAIQRQPAPVRDAYEARILAGAALEYTPLDDGRILVTLEYEGTRYPLCDATGSELAGEDLREPATMDEPDATELATDVDAGHRRPERRRAAAPRRWAGVLERGAGSAAVIRRAVARGTTVRGDLVNTLSSALGRAWREQRTLVLLALALILIAIAQVVFGLGWLSGAVLMAGPVSEFELPEARARLRAGDLVKTMRRIVDAAGDNELTKAQHDDFAKASRELNGIRAELGEPVVFDQSTGATITSRWALDEAEAWGSKSHFSTHSARGVGAGDIGGPSDGARGWKSDDGTVRVLTNKEQLAAFVGKSQGDPLSMGRYIKAVVTGDWKGVDIGPETKAASEGIGSAGGYLVPELLSAGVIDRARAQAVVLRAGALTVPMESAELSIGRLATGITPGWKSENATAVASDPTFERVTFRTRTLIGLAKCSVELMEDVSTLQGTVENEFSKGLALELDRACLRGTGAANEPLGIINQPGILTTAVGGALTRYQNVVTSVRDLRIQNFEPDFLILAPRTQAFYDGLEDTTNQPLRPPEVWGQLQKLNTTSIPTNLGGGSDTEVYYGKGSELMVGIRTRLRIEVSREAADSSGSAFSDLQVWVRAYLRADVALAHPAAFLTLTGVTS